MVDPRLVNLHLHSSKTNSYKEQVTTKFCLAKNDSDYCPVATVLAYYCSYTKPATGSGGLIKDSEIFPDVLS